MAFQLLRDLWIALANESSRFDGARLSEEIAAVRKMQAEAEKGATEAPVITPVAESVARITESPASENGNGTAIPSLAEETPEDSAASKPLDTPHDYKQPA